MGNNRSRVAPKRTLRILDSETRARFQNQHELVQLRVKLRDIRVKHNEELSRITFDQHDVKMKLHELQHEQRQRELFNEFDKRNRPESTLSPSESDLSDESDLSTMNNSSLLLHNLNASMKWEKSIIFPNTQKYLSNQTKSVNSFETRRLQYSSKLDPHSDLFEQTNSSLLSNSLSLKQHSERMKSSIQIAVARAARDSHTAARRNNRAY